MPIEGDGGTEGAGDESTEGVHGHGHGGAASGPIDGKETEEDGAIYLPEEIQEVKRIKSPPMPTPEEVEKHRVSHLPYRCWCPECVEAFGREWPHKAGSERSIPPISCDYLYVTKNGIFARHELSDEERDAAARVLVMYCGATQAPFADGVPHKGVDADGYVIECVTRNVLWLGHAKVTLRADNEPALALLIDRATAALKSAGVEHVTEEGSVPYDAQTNGAAENAVRLCKGMFKVLLLGFEREIKARIPLDHPLVPWLFRHGAYLRALQVRGAASARMRRTAEALGFR